MDDQSNKTGIIQKLIVKWSSSEYEIDCLDPENTISDIKDCIQSKTGVKPERQKLMGLKMKNGFYLFVCNIFIIIDVFYF